MNRDRKSFEHFLAVELVVSMVCFALAFVGACYIGAAVMGQL